jgi:hypothetical protein
MVVHVIMILSRLIGRPRRAMVKVVRVVRSVEGKEREG